MYFTFYIFLVEQVTGTRDCRQRADEWLLATYYHGIQEPLVVRHGWKTSKRTLWQCTASVCVVGVHCWDLLGVSTVVKVRGLGGAQPPCSHFSPLQ